MFLDGSNHILEENLGGEGVAVIDDRLSIVSIPTVHCTKEEWAIQLAMLYTTAQPDYEWDIHFMDANNAVYYCTA